MEMLPFFSIYTIWKQTMWFSSWLDKCLKCLYQRPTIIIKTPGITLEINPSLKNGYQKNSNNNKKKNCKDITDLNKMESNVNLIWSRISQFLSGE